MGRGNSFPNQYFIYSLGFLFLSFFGLGFILSDFSIFKVIFDWLKKFQKVQISIGITLFPIGITRFPIGNRRIPIGEMKKKKRKKIENNQSKIHHSEKKNQNNFQIQSKYRDRYSTSEYSQENVVILQGTEKEIRISHPADEYLAKDFILETDHPADRY